MSKLSISLSWPETLGVTNDITKLVQVNRVAQDIYEEAGLGGSADIFRGTYTKEDGEVSKVAIKCIRAFNMEKNTKAEMERVQKKLLRELEIWRSLTGGTNIIKLLGMINGIGPLPSFVCELCPWNLQDSERPHPQSTQKWYDYLNNYYNDDAYTQPVEFQQMADTLRGLCYMHGMDSGPIAHGDIKLSNILVNSDETALICDFGRSLKPIHQSNELLLTNSSPFAGTVRYMSPELLVPESAVPSPAADMWAYGCVSLEILCRIQPYNDTSSDVVIAQLIRNGRLPSNRPQGPRGRLVNDALWELLTSCWQAQDWRPTARGFLEELDRMVDSGEISNSPIPMDIFAITESGPIPAWPHEIEDLKDQLRDDRFSVRSRSPRATVWRGTTVTGQTVVVKVPRLNTSSNNQTRHDHLEHIFRRVVSSRYGVHHPNIINLLGITSGFSPHEGLVFEECYEWRLDEYRRKMPVIIGKYTRSVDPYPTSHSLMCDILEGLRYIHDYPIPIPHGDLTPENISVDDHGRAKISLMSFGGMLAALPRDAAVTATVVSVLSFRWMGPELVTANNPQPTTESDMWTIGCIFFWLLTLCEPYSLFKRDELAGAEVMRGKPPATLARADYRAFWATNGLWNAIARCWRQDPLQRPTATEFIKFLTRLEGRNMDLDWLPIHVVDLTGKVRFNLSERQEKNRIASHTSIWRRFDDTKSEIREEVQVQLALYQATYSPKWYSKVTGVLIKAEYNHKSNEHAREALYSGMRHEVALMSQIDHPCIHKLLGIDSSPSHTYLPDMVFESLPRLTLHLLLIEDKNVRYEYIPLLRDVASALAYLHEHTAGSIAHGNIQPANIFVLPNGRAKLANFTCAFQHISGLPTETRQLSGAISVPPKPSLYCSPESQDPFEFPTLAGDVWSFGTLVLSCFSAAFQNSNLEQHMERLREGISPVDLQEISADCNARIIPLLRQLLNFEPANRPAMSSVFSELSRLL